MTSKQLINHLCYEYNTINYNEEKLKATQEIKKDLEVLEIIKKYLVRTFDYPEGGNYFCLELHKFIYEKEGMKFKEWIENGKIN